MVGGGSINRALLRRLAAAHWTAKECAEFFGCSQSRIMRAAEKPGDGGPIFFRGATVGALRDYLNDGGLVVRAPEGWRPAMTPRDRTWRLGALDADVYLETLACHGLLEPIAGPLWRRAGRPARPMRTQGDGSALQ